MRTAGIVVLVGTVVVAGLLLLLWLVGLVAHIGGGLIHLLLIPALLLGPVGILAGAILIIVGSSKSRQR